MSLTAYDILEIPIEASLREIKQAYHRLARQYHPDICKEPDALDRMKNINLAYEAIKDGRGRWWSPPIEQTLPELPTLAEMIAWANTHVVDDEYLLTLLVGGRDQYSRMKLPELIAQVGEDVARRVQGAMYNDRLRATALRWCLRGLSAELAIRKAWADDKFYRDKARSAS